MKRSLFLAIALATSAISQAQTDVTNKYITNPSFEQNGTAGWTVNSLVTQSNNSFKKKQGGVYIEKWVSSNNTVGNASVSQVLSDLEPGKYTLTVAAQNLSQADENKKCTGVKIYAGSTSTPVYTPDDYSISFTHLEGDITIGFTATNATGNWLAVDNFRLTYEGAPDIDIMKSSLNTLIDQATKLYANGQGLQANLLKQAIDKAQTIIDKADATNDEALQAYKELKDAIGEYQLANVSEDNPLDYTRYIQNPSFEAGGTKGWTSESLATQTNTSFTKKQGSTYLEKWVAKGSAVGNAYLMQQLTGLPNGQYKLVVAAQNLNQNSTTQKCKGAVIFADGNEEPVYTPGDYTLRFRSVAGEVKIGFSANGANGNWLAVDNFRLYLIGKVSMADVVDEIQSIVSDAEKLTNNMMSNTAANLLQQAIAQGKDITEESSEADVQAAKKTLEEAIRKAQESIANYAKLEAAIQAAQQAIEDDKEGYEAFHEEIDRATALAHDGSATQQQLADAVEALAKAQLAFNLANASHSATIKVTKTNHYVPTGANEALMRATFSGTALEKGVCWSTQHEPTVLDGRTSEHHTNNGDIYHVRGLEPATVYYLRPYIMSKTYEVAYGDEVKIVTHPKGTCRGTWNEGAPTPEANERCRNAINETIEYFNQWTGIKGFTLTGNYGADTPTADCSYGGWMRIGPNTGNQAIGTVIHETGHGVGVGTRKKAYGYTTGCWDDTNVHDWVWKGREANDMFHFLENRYQNEDGNFMVGDGTHGWGQNASYDWFVNGADKDRHVELQYLGGCCLLYGLFIDGLCPTDAYANGLPGYTYNFDDAKRYYLMCKDAERGLSTGFLYQRTSTGTAWATMTDGEVGDSAAWYMEYLPTSGYYRFRNAATGKYLSHASGIQLKSSATSTENFQLMPDRTDVTITAPEGKLTTHGYWFTWNASGNKAMQAAAQGSKGYGTLNAAVFDYSDKATTQQWIILSEEQLKDYGYQSTATGIAPIPVEDNNTTTTKSVRGIYSPDGITLSHPGKGLNIIHYTDGSTKKVIFK